MPIALDAAYRPLLDAATAAKAFDLADLERSPSILDRKPWASAAAARREPDVLPPPAFQRAAGVATHIADAVAHAATFVDDPGWQADESPVKTTEVWKLPAPTLYTGSGVQPFKCRGVVAGCSPTMLAALLLDLGLKWPTRHSTPAKGKLDVRKLAQLDWQTATWFEIEPIPVPFVAARENAYVAHWTALPGGGVEITRSSLPEILAPELGRGRVRGRAFVVMRLLPTANGGTLMTMAMELDLGGSLPGSLVSRFLADQAKLFNKLADFAATELGQAAIAHWEAQVRLSSFSQ
jgi:hypothetical protein